MGSVGTRAQVYRLGAGRSAGQGAGVGTTYTPPTTLCYLDTHVLIIPDSLDQRRLWVRIPARMSKDSPGYRVLLVPWVAAGRTKYSVGILHTLQRHPCQYPSLPRSTRPKPNIPTHIRDTVNRERSDFTRRLVKLRLRKLTDLTDPCHCSSRIVTESRRNSQLIQTVCAVHSRLP